MNIAINAYSAKVGGGKTYLYNLLRRLPDDESIRVFLFCHDDLDYGNAPEVTRVQVNFPVYSPLTRWIWERFFFKYWLVRLDIDVLFVPGGTSAVRVPGKCRLITMFRNMLPFDDAALIASGSILLRVKNFFLKKNMLRTMASADLVIFISEYAKKVIENNISIKSSVTIPHGIGESFFVSDIELPRPNLPFADEYILYVSRFEFYKRHLELVKAYSSLDKDLQARYKLVLVGGGKGQAADAVKNYIQANSLEECVFLLGEYPYEELPALYKHSKLFVFASACENCPNILLEAMGAGVPVLCSSYDPMPEFGGAAVSYISPDDPGALADALEVSLSNKEELIKKSSGVAAHSRRYSWENTARLTWAAISRVSRN